MPSLHEHGATRAWVLGGIGNYFKGLIDIRHLQNRSLSEGFCWSFAKCRTLMRIIPFPTASPWGQSCSGIAGPTERGDPKGCRK